MSCEEVNCRERAACASLDSSYDKLLACVLKNSVRLLEYLVVVYLLDHVTALYKDITCGNSEDIIGVKLLCKSGILIGFKAGERDVVALVKLCERVVE